MKAEGEGTMTRDMTKAQFRAACERSGFVSEMLGYYRLPIPGQHVAVNVHNAGDRWRDRLAYLHAETARLEKKYVAGQVQQEATRDHSKCSFCTGIGGEITAGTGSLDDNGYWSEPCDSCADRLNRTLQTVREKDKAEGR